MPYPQLVKPRRNRASLLQPPIGIDYSNPITDGIVGCYALNTPRTGPIPELVKGGLPGLTLAGSATQPQWRLTPQGYGIGNTTASGIYGGSALIPSALGTQLTGSAGCTVFCYGLQSAATSNANFKPSISIVNSGFGVNGTGAVFGIWFNSTGLQLYWNIGGAVSGITSAALNSAGFRSWAGTFVPGGKANLYVGGISQVTGNVTAGSPTLSTPSFVVLANTSVTIPYSLIVAALFDRVLGPNEIASLNSDPYQFLVLAEDVVAAQFGGLAARSASLSAAIAALSNSAVGKVIVSGQL